MNIKQPSHRTAFVDRCIKISGATTPGAGIAILRKRWRRIVVVKWVAKFRFWGWLGIGNGFLVSNRLAAAGCDIQIKPTCDHALCRRRLARGTKRVTVHRFPQPCAAAG